MRKILIALSFLFAISAFAADPASNTTAKTEVVGVKGMVCAFCAQGITKKFKEQPEIADVDVSLEKKIVKLTYKDGKALTHEKIASLLKDAGYEVSFGK